MALFVKKLTVSIENYPFVSSTERFISTAMNSSSVVQKLGSKGQQPFTVFIEGNIGSGKTTFLEHFRKFDEVCLMTEPVEQWRDCGGVNLLVSIFSIFLLNCYDSGELSNLGFDVQRTTSLGDAFPNVCNTNHVKYTY